MESGGGKKKMYGFENKELSSDDRRTSRLRPIDPNMDPKKLKRVMASRQYSQKYRMKQLHYITYLETEVKSLQTEVEITSPRIKYANRQNSLLRMENGSMKERLSFFSNDLMFKEAQYEELKNERDLWKQFYSVNLQPLPDFLKTAPISGNFLQFENLNNIINNNPFNPFM